MSLIMIENDQTFLQCWLSPSSTHHHLACICMFVVKVCRWMLNDDDIQKSLTFLRSHSQIISVMHVLQLYRSSDLNSFGPNPNEIAFLIYLLKIETEPHHKTSLNDCSCSGDPCEKPSRANCNQITNFTRIFKNETIFRKLTHSIVLYLLGN